jgi:2'-5' RNA ligase
VDKIRSFLAVDFRGFFRDDLDPLIGALQKQIPDVKWIRPEAAHITLHFFGSISQETVDAIARVLEPAFATQPSFSVSLAGLGAFPAWRHPRVFWVGLAGQVEELKKLQKLAVPLLGAIGVGTESREFKPHLTLGRAREGRPHARAGAPPPEGNLDFRSREAFRVEEAVLFRSDLSPQGPRYTPLLRFPLHGARAE